MSLTRLLHRAQVLSGLRGTYLFYSTGANENLSAKPKAVKSMTPAGVHLKRLNIKKNGEDPVALPDEEYPEWLWKVLDKEAQEQKLRENPDLAARKLRRKNNKAKIKENNFLASMK